LMRNLQIYSRSPHLLLPRDATSPALGALHIISEFFCWKQEEGRRRRVFNQRSKEASQLGAKMQLTRSKSRPIHCLPRVQLRWIDCERIRFNVFRVLMTRRMPVQVCSRDPAHGCRSLKGAHCWQADIWAGATQTSRGEAQRGLRKSPSTSWTNL
jgi:hypothetical protein